MVSKISVFQTLSIIAVKWLSHTRRRCFASVSCTSTRQHPVLASIQTLLEVAVNLSRVSATPQAQAAAVMGLLARCNSTHPVMLLLVLLAVAQKAAEATTYTSWHECSAQAVYGGAYGAEVLGNLSDFRSNLLSKVWQSFDPTVPYLEVRKAHTVC